jgi:hypothetical protein
MDQQALQERRRRGLDIAEVALGIASRAPPPSLIMTTESPIRISVGASDWSLPPAPNTVFKNPTKPTTSPVKILGVTVCRPSGWNAFMSCLQEGSPAWVISGPAG